MTASSATAVFSVCRTYRYSLWRTCLYRVVPWDEFRHDARSEESTAAFRRSFA